MYSYVRLTTNRFYYNYYMYYTSLTVFTNNTLVVVVVILSMKSLEHDIKTVTRSSKSEMSCTTFINKMTTLSSLKVQM